MVASAVRLIGGRSIIRARIRHRRRAGFGSRPEGRGEGEVRGERQEIPCLEVSGTPLTVSWY
jgi:hypothetical protein